jgi:hypothetical protein
MPVIAPLTSSGSRDLEKKPRPIPKAVKDAVTLMVYGRPDDPDGRPLDFVGAGKVCGIRPDVMRRWLDKPTVRALIHAERRAFRAAICAGNELALQRVRDKSENGMAVIGSVRALEQIDDAEEMRPAARQTIPGFVIVINGPSAHMPRSPTIEATPVSESIDEADKVSAITATETQ